jgi:hypothetical protein
MVAGNDRRKLELHMKAVVKGDDSDSDSDSDSLDRNRPPGNISIQYNGVEK